MNALPAPVIQLAHGTAGHPVGIPQFGFGTYKIAPRDAERAVLDAIELGYRHLDTAEMYGNEAEVGAAIAHSGVPRDDFFVTSKLNNPFHEPSAVRRAFDATMDALGLDVLDLFLVHWPMAESTDLVATWQAMVGLLQTGRLRAVGVSNYQPDHLRAIIEATGVTPAVNQIEVHPYLTQDSVRAIDAELGIVTEAWSPLGRGKVLADPVLHEIAAERGRTVSQVVLRWHLQRGDAVFPKSVHRERIAENAALFDFELSEGQMDRITALNRDQRVGSHPDAVQSAV